MVQGNRAELYETPIGRVCSTARLLAWAPRSWLRFCEPQAIQTP